MPASLPMPPENANERALAAWSVERFTGLTTATVTLARNVDAASGLLLVWKNGTLVDPATVSVAGAKVTLGGALIAGDVVVVYYKARGV